MVLWDELVVTLNKEIQELSKSLANGSAQDYASYRQIVGRIEGIEWAKANLQSIIRKRIHEDNEED